MNIKAETYFTNYIVIKLAMYIISIYLVCRTTQLSSKCKLVCFADKICADYDNVLGPTIQVNLLSCMEIAHKLRLSIIKLFIIGNG